MSRTDDVTKIAQETMRHFEKKIDAYCDKKEVEMGYAEALCELADLAAKTHAEAMGVSLAEYYRDRAESLAPRGPCGMRNHSADCDCGGAGGDR